MREERYLVIKSYLLIGQQSPRKFKGFKIVLTARSGLAVIVCTSQQRHETQANENKKLCREIFSSLNVVKYQIPKRRRKRTRRQMNQIFSDNLFVHFHQWRKKNKISKRERNDPSNKLRLDG